MSAASKVIVALDSMGEEESLLLAEQLSGSVWGFKVNDLLLECGVSIIAKLKPFGRVFADPKLYDIPNTVGNSVARLSDAGADIITVHSSAGERAMEQAAAKRGSAEIFAITVLTSFSPEETKELFKASPIDAVSSLAMRAQACGVQGVVCSPEELEILSKTLEPNFKKLTPGVRPAWYGTKDDQSRVATPKQAVERGADYLVIGRPITKSDNPREAAQKIVEELA
jgi:orotidine-5'-phosphate decarboxylase